MEEWTSVLKTGKVCREWCAQEYPFQKTVNDIRGKVQWKLDQNYTVYIFPTAVVQLTGYFSFKVVGIYILFIGFLISFITLWKILP